MLAHKLASNFDSSLAFLQQWLETTLEDQTQIFYHVKQKKAQPDFSVSEHTPEAKMSFLTSIKQRDTKVKEPIHCSKKLNECLIYLPRSNLITVICSLNENLCSHHTRVYDFPPLLGPSMQMMLVFQMEVHFPAY